MTTSAVATSRRLARCRVSGTASVVLLGITTAWDSCRCAARSQSCCSIAAGDLALLKQTWTLAQSLGDELPLFFYSPLFLSHPELRSMFPVPMATQRDRLVGALGRIVSSVDELDEVTDFIQQLGRDHRRFE